MLLNGTSIHVNKSSLLASITPSALSSTTPPLTIMSSPGGTIAGALILSMAFLLGVPGNLFVIWSIVVRTRRQSVTTLLILNLACADGALMVLTPFFIAYLIKRSWVFGLAMCKAMYYLCCANMYASIFMITLMSLHRVVAVVWPHRVRTITGRRKVARAIAVLWILALALSVPVLVFRETYRMLNGETRMYVHVCDCKHDQPKYAVMQYTMETLLAFILPYSLMLASYLCILHRIRQTRFERRIRTEKLILAIVVTFAVLWLPYHIVNMMQVTEVLKPEYRKIHQIRTALRPFASAMAFVSSCINPILYMFAGKSYMRRAGLAFMARLFDATGRDSSSRKTCRSSQINKVQQEGEAERLRNKETNSTTSGNSSDDIKPTEMQNGN
ncbi:leukotriene B4 receptor 2a [Trichomycterus rosablanca]|uniref:leukotriene B4 receptor 2a n=1 Tax=Trichomycterus rosablanca TaxID=2290929 RepID=UPI002F357263